jgi:hypothetical protein
MAATVLAYIATGVATVGAPATTGTAEGGITHGRDASITSTAVIPIPTSTGTHFSYPKWLFLDVTATGGSSTTISNRTVAIATATSTGVHHWFKYVAQGSYVQPAGNLAADAGGNGATPATYTECTTSPGAYDASGITNNTGANGGYCVSGIGIDNLYAGGGGTASLPSLSIAYDEGP